MACDPATLLDQAKCINACIPPGMMPAVNAALLCNRVSAGAILGGQLRSGLVHYWKLDEIAGSSRVDSIGSITLTENTPPINSGIGKKNNAAKGPNAAGSSLLALNLPVLFLNPSTIAFWANMANLPPGLSTNFASDGGAGSSIRFDTLGNVLFRINFVTVVTIALGTLNSWHLIVMTLNNAGTVLSASIDNGIFSTGVPGLTPAGLSTIFLEASFDIFDGSMDEIAIWNRPLSQSEVAILWNNGAGRFL